MIDRPRLLARLDAAAITVLCAPTGYGKSVLLRQWCDSNASRGTVVHFADVHTPEMGSRRTSNSIEVAGHAATPAAHVARPMFLSVDMADDVPAAVLRGLMLICRAHPGSRLAMAMRNADHLTSSDVAHHDVTIIDVGELAFTAEESEELFADSPIAADRVAQFHARLAGWPSAMAAAAIAANGPTSDEKSVMNVVDAAARSGERNRPGTNHLAIIDEPAFRSIDRPTAALIARSEVGNGTTELRHTLNDGALPAPLRDALDQLMDSDGPSATTVHRQLARHFDANRQWALALSHAISASDWAHARTLIELHWPMIMIRQREVLHRAVTTIPMRTLRKSTTAMAVTDIILGLPDHDTSRWLRTLPEHPDQLAAIAHSPQAPRRIEEALAVMVALRLRRDHLRGCLLGGRLEQLIAATRGHEPPETVARTPAILLQVGITQLLAGEFATAIDTMHRAFLARRYAMAEGSYITADSCAKLSLGYALLGEVNRSGDWRAAFADSRSESAPLGNMISSSVHAATAISAIDSLDLGTAATALRELDRYLVDATYYSHSPDQDPWTDIYLLAHARHALACGDPIYALQRIRGRPMPIDDSRGAIEAQLLAAQAELLLAAGHGEHAGALIGQAGGHPALIVARARLALLSGQTDAANEHAVAGIHHHLISAREHLQLQLVAAVAEHRRGNGQSAETHFRAAVSRAAVTGCLWPFVTVPRAELLELADTVPDAADIISRIMAARIDNVFPTTVTLVEITPREHDVLHHLATGLTGAQIAAKLFISHNTFKFHSRALYRKLGARTRQEALAQARRFGLVRTR